MTSLGCRRQGTKGRCRVGGATHPSPRSAATAAAAAGACSTSPGWWNASTVRSSHSAHASTPPSPTWSTMSWSRQPIVAAAARSAARSTCRGPGNCVRRVDLLTGTQRSGSAQSQMMPRAHATISSCSITTVGTGGTSAGSPSVHRRSAATAASAAANQLSTLPSYTPSRNSWPMAMSPFGRCSASRPTLSITAARPSPRGSGLRVLVLARLPSRVVGCGVHKSPGMGSGRGALRPLARGSLPMRKAPASRGPPPPPR
eukprot:946335-Pleurochrysis_carterae.AAC.1